MSQNLIRNKHVGNQIVDRTNTKGSLSHRVTYWFSSCRTQISKQLIHQIDVIKKTDCSFQLLFSALTSFFDKRYDFEGMIIINFEI